ncbi:hypothetical protein [Pantoea sp. App145]|uniref:hypothetical protein n=1 Tax=Pantoea sp. App145 TaxID=3071567 RepID=UPI003A802EF4
MSVGAISTSYGTTANNIETNWHFVQCHSGGITPVNLSNYIIDIAVTNSNDITLDNCKVGIKNREPEKWEVIFSSDGRVKLNECTIKGIVYAPNGDTEIEKCLIQGKVDGRSAPVTLITTEIRSPDYTKYATVPESGFGEWINALKDHDDEIYQFTTTDIERYSNLLEMNTERYGLYHIAISTDDNDIECRQQCKIYGDIINDVLDIENPTRDIKVFDSMIAGSIVNRTGSTLLERSSAKAVYSNTQKTEVNNSDVGFIYSVNSDTHINNHSVIKHGAMLGGMMNRISSSTLHGSVQLKGQTLTIEDHSIIDKVCLPQPHEVRGEFDFTEIRLNSGSTLHAIETEGQRCRLFIGKDAVFTPLNTGEPIPANVEIHFI